jgi:hypothetical protein
LPRSFRSAEPHGLTPSSCCDLSSRRAPLWASQRTAGRSEALALTSFREELKTGRLTKVTCGSCHAPGNSQPRRASRPPRLLSCYGKERGTGLRPGCSIDRNRHVGHSVQQKRVEPHRNRPRNRRRELLMSSRPCGPTNAVAPQTPFASEIAALTHVPSGRRA